MNKVQKIIISVYATALAAGLIAMLFVGDGGITLFSTLVIGTPLAILLFFVWKTKSAST